MPRKILLWIAITSTLLGFAPVMSVLASSAVAKAAQCGLDEGSSHPCHVLGVELGGLLYSMFVSGWFIFLTWPLVLLGIALGAVSAIMASVGFRPRRLS